MELEAQILERLTPDATERSAVNAARAALEEAATKKLAEADVDGTAQVQGSIAKDTWIAGAADMDCFLLLAPTTPDSELEPIVSRVAESVLEQPRKKYAQHPYIIGQRDGFQVDLVPAYRIEDPLQRLSAVDRTPLHTQWVHANLDEAERGQVRLAKQWAKGVGAYGAETRIGGLSGYLIEVLIHRFKGFHGFLDWCNAGSQPRRLAFGDDGVNDDVSPLVVVDPVDPTRNCAAAVTHQTLELLQSAAKAYAAEASERFFFPAPPRPEPASVLSASMNAQGATWTGLVLEPKTDRLDMIFPQFQRAARVAADGLTRAGFPVQRVSATPFDGDKAVGLSWVMEDVTLPTERQHRGPRASQEPNAKKFRAKWANHPDTVGPIEADDQGLLQVTVAIRDRTPAEWLQSNFSQVLTGKHVVAAMGDAPTFLTEPASVPDEWAALVADQILNRFPWQRP